MDAYAPYRKLFQTFDDLYQSTRRNASHVLTNSHLCQREDALHVALYFSTVLCIASPFSIKRDTLPVGWIFFHTPCKCDWGVERLAAGHCAVLACCEQWDATPLLWPACTGGYLCAVCWEVPAAVSLAEAHLLWSISIVFTLQGSYLQPFLYWAHLSAGEHFF